MKSKPGPAEFFKNKVKLFKDNFKGLKKSIKGFSKLSKKKKTEVVLTLAISFVLLTGLASAAFLAGTNSDIRQQASGGDCSYAKNGGYACLSFSKCVQCVDGKTENAKPSDCSGPCNPANQAALTCDDGKGNTYKEGQAACAGSRAGSCVVCKSGRFKGADDSKCKNLVCGKDAKPEPTKVSSRPRPTKTLPLPTDVAVPSAIPSAIPSPVDEYVARPVAAGGICGRTAYDQECVSGYECSDNRCVSSRPNIVKTQREDYESCSSDGQCKSDNCQPAPGGQFCFPPGQSAVVTKKPGETCGTNNYNQNCVSGYECSDNKCILTKTVYNSKKDNREKCSNDNECKSGWCAAYRGASLCATRPPEPAKTCNWFHNNFFCSFGCEPTTEGGKCKLKPSPSTSDTDSNSKKDNREKCSNDNECKSGWCAAYRGASLCATRPPEPGEESPDSDIGDLLITSIGLANGGAFSAGIDLDNIEFSFVKNLLSALSYFIR